MTIKVRFFASLRERLAEPVASIDGAGVSTVADVWERATGTEAVPSHVLCSVNLEHRELGDPVSDGDEVAFFPPVTGG